MKKLIHVFLVLLLITAAFAGNASAEAFATPEPERHTSGVCVYIVLDDGTAEIVDTSGKFETLDIPEELDGYPVSRIGDYAFRQCYDLTSISIPDSITGIGNNPFLFCSRLTEINVSLDHPTIATINGVLFSKPDRRLVFYPMKLEDEHYRIPKGIRVIGDSAFSYCDALHSVTIPDTVTTIGALAFSASRYITTIEMPNSITRIGDHAFSNCMLLKEITIPDGVVSIGDEAFRNCFYLKSITIPDSVTEIGDNPFQKCERLKEILVSPNHPFLESVDGVLFNRQDKQLLCYPCGITDKEYIIPDGVREIGNYAFAFNSALKSVIIPDSVVSIGKGAFEYSDVLTEIKIPEGVTSIGDNAFTYCTALKEITIPGSVVSIGQLAFCNCEALTGIIIPDGVKSIGYYAFGNCDALTSITVPESLTEIGDYAFGTAKSLTVTVPRGSYPEQYCKDNNIRYIYPDTYDWLND